MWTLIGLVIIYWGFQMLEVDASVEGAFWFFGGIALILFGLWVATSSLGMPLDTGRAFG